MNGIRELLALAQRLERARRVQYMVARSAQNGADQLSYLRFVLDQQNGSGLGRGSLGGAKTDSRRVRHLVATRQVDHERCAAARLARNRNTTAALFDHAEHRRQAEARALAVGL